jgi:hypothetical protein
MSFEPTAPAGPPVVTPYRAEWTTAFFRDAQFYVASGTKLGGQRIALHEFPKKTLPYAENMGRRAFRFSVRAYVITYPQKEAARSAAELQTFDYRDPRDFLQARLDDGIPGPLLFYPTIRGISTMPKPIVCSCEHYRMTEEERFGGYCVFDIDFVEFGSPPNQPIPATGNVARNAITNLQNVTVDGTVLGPAPVIQD